MSVNRGCIAAACLMALAPGHFLSARTVGPTRFRLPLSFEQNLGQAGPTIRFVARRPGYAMGLYAGGSTLQLGDTGRRLEIVLPGANPEAPALGESPLPGRVNYLKGAGSSEWLAGVPTFARVRFVGVYPGIDVLYYGRGNELEYDFEVAPGADPGQIRLHASGADEIRIDSHGDLVIRAAGREVRHHKPRLLQRIATGVREVDGRFLLDRGGEVRFDVGEYDKTATLTIDPVLTYSSFLGGSLDDRAYGMAVDSSGYIYVAGETSSLNIPVANPITGALSGTSDAFLLKLNPAGNALVYATYLGGSDRDGARGVALDGAGAVYLTGFTRSQNFPNTAGAYKRTSSGGDDVFVTKLAASGGSIVYSTYLGGSSNEQARGIAVDATGRAYVAGYTTSVNFPRVQAVQAVFGGSTDAFAARLDAAGAALEFSTYLGGSSNDTANGIAVDASGAAHITGQTQSSNFPARNAIQAQKAFDADGFIVKLAPAGDAFAYSTFLGGSAVDEAKAIALDTSGNAYVTGRTYSKNLPITTGAYQSALRGDQDVFVAKINAVGSTLVYCTYLGGSGPDDSSAIAVAGGEAYVVGDTSSMDFPTLGAGQTAFAGTRDAYLAVLSADGSSLKGATYLGGSRDDYGRAVAVLNGQVYLAGYTFSSNFPTTSGAYSRAYTGSADMFLAAQGTPAAMISPAPGSTLTSGSVTFNWANAPGATAYRLDIGGAEGGTELYSANLGPATSQAINLPADGRNLYVRLWTEINTWGYTDYTYKAMSSGIKAVIASPAPGSTLGVSAVFVWSAGQSVTEYWLYVGHAVGQGDIYSATQGTGLSRTVTIPTDGSTIYVRLSSKIAGAWDNNDYVYQATQPAATGKGAMVSPVPGSQLAGSTVTFNWSPGSAGQFWLDIGSSAGGSDFYDGNQGTATGRTVSGLPLDSRTLYVRLWSSLNGQWTYSDYTYTAAAQSSAAGGTGATPVLLSPAPGSRVATSAITFSWAPGTGVTSYWLDVGPYQGSGNYFDGGVGTSTSTPVSGIPTGGTKIWVRLWWQKNGTWSYQDYSFN